MNFEIEAWEAFGVMCTEAELEMLSLTLSLCLSFAMSPLLLNSHVNDLIDHSTCAEVGVTVCHLMRIQ